MQLNDCRNTLKSVPWARDWLKTLVEFVLTCGQRMFKKNKTLI